MDLEQALQNYPGVRLATESDNEAILSFFAHKEMTTSSLSIGYDRSPNFFKFLKMQSDDYKVFCAESTSSAVTGVASVSMADGYIEGEVRRVGYLGDLRISFDRRILSQWRRLYADLLSPERSYLSGARYLLTAVLDENIQAFRALIQAKNSHYKYEAVATYKIVQLFSWPFRKSSRLKEKETYERGRPEDKKNLLEFMDGVQKRLLFGFPFTEENWSRREKIWGIGIEDFHMIRREGKIQACVALWAPNSSKRIVISSMPLLIRLAVRLWNFFYRSHQLPLEGETLKSSYLTHLFFAPELSPLDKARYFSHLVSKLLDSQQKHSKPHCLSFADFEGLAKELNWSIRHELNATLYSVRHVDTASITSALQKSDGVAFEMALV